MTSAVAGPARRAAVLGHPVAHSRSPILHMAAYRRLGLSTWRYECIDCDETRFPQFIGSLGSEWVGLSLTRPLKWIAMQFADEVSPLAEAVGAANTLVFTPRGRRAENTDVQGIVGALRAAGVNSIGSALVLGAGGTAQAALAALRELGRADLTVMVRDLTRTRELRATADRLGVHPRVVDGLLDATLPEADLIISTLPRGAADSLQMGAAGTAAPRVVLDVVYAPWPTPMAVAARAAGAIVVSGLSMLLYQAAEQVALMTGRAAPIDAMRDALAAAVPGSFGGLRTAGPS